MADVWASGRLTAVIHPVNKDPVTQERMYRRAQFDFLEWDSDGDGVPERYISVPIYIQPATAQFQETGQEWDIGLTFGKYRQGQIIIDASNPGNDDSWYGLHSFGFY